MKINVSNGVNYYLEAISILNTFQKKDGYFKELRESFAHKYNIPIDKTENMFKDIVKIYDYVVNSISISKDKLDFYFSSTNDDAPALSELLLYTLIFSDDYNNVEYLLEQSESHKLKDIAKILFYSLDYDDININNATFIDIINSINKLDVDTDMKYKYTLLCCNINDYLNQVMIYVNEAIYLLKDKEAELQHIADEFRNDIKIDIEKYGDSFFERYDIKFDMHNDIVLRPSIMGSNYLMIKPDFTKKETLNTYMGVCIKAINELKKEYFISDERTISILKALGDKSKFDILKSINEKEMYGAEIAKMLNLTTATVSHHMSNLYNLSLVNIITDNNKINYTLNKESIKELINILERMFLN